MEILVVGVNHKTAPVEIRERLSVPYHRTGDFLRTLAERQVFDERLVLSTCNRTEIYGVGLEPSEAIRRAKEFLSEYSKLSLSDFEDKLYVLRQPQSIEHLFLVASGLDSMVVGETEIIGQVKDAYQSAHREQQTGKVLNTLFQRSFRVAKNLRTQTDVGHGRVSVASVAADLASKIFEDLSRVRVMLIGTGEMASQVARTMISKGAQLSITSTHHADRGEALAAELGGRAVPFSQFEESMRESDILISATYSPEAVVHESQVRGWMKARHEKPLFMIDVAVPRNIEASVERLDNVYLYNVDDLKGIADKNRVLRESQIGECLKLVGEHTQRYMDWLFRESGAKRVAG